MVSALVVSALVTFYAVLLSSVRASLSFSRRLLLFFSTAHPAQESKRFRLLPSPVVSGKTEIGVCAEGVCAPPRKKRRRVHSGFGSSGFAFGPFGATGKIESSSAESQKNAQKEEVPNPGVWIQISK